MATQGSDGGDDAVLEPPTYAERVSTALWGPLLMRNAERVARLLRWAPWIRPEAQGIAVERGLAYGPRPEHRFDLYRPAGAAGPLPLAIYIHGGGFQFFDRETHWPMATALARGGFVVASVDYRLAPRHRFPAAVEDVALAYAELTHRAAALGASADGVVLAGESAGANLALGLAIARCWRHPADYAAAVWDAPLHPTALLPACGYLQVSEPQRHRRHRRLPAILEARVQAVSRQYLPEHTPARPEHAFANPLLLLEAAGPPERPFPPTHALVGDRDPVVSDTLRLGAALRRLNIPVETPVYPGRGHTFHALTFTAAARQAWQAQLAFVTAVRTAAEVGG